MRAIEPDALAARKQFNNQKLIQWFNEMER